MLPALGVSALTVAVVWQLLDGWPSRFSRRLIASAVGLLILLEGSLLLLTLPDTAAMDGMTPAVHGVALICAGAGIWAIAHRSGRKPQAASQG